jgi:hypothetical protein
MEALALKTLGFMSDGEYHLLIIHADGRMIISCLAKKARCISLVKKTVVTDALRALASI